MSPIRFRMSPIRFRMTPIRFRMYPIRFRMSPIRYRMSHSDENAKRSKNDSLIVFQWGFSLDPQFRMILIFRRNSNFMIDLN